MKVNIPNNIKERLVHFQEEVKKYFSFLANYGYSHDKVEMGRKDLLLDYYCEIIFKNGNTKISIGYSTDALNGSQIAFPDVKEKPIFDNLISCYISDSNAFMSIRSFAEAKLPAGHFLIPLNVENLDFEISRVLKNYADFFQNNLIDVLKKDKIYDCHTDRFNDKIFKEINYR